MDEDASKPADDARPDLRRMFGLAAADADDADVEVRDDEDLPPDIVCALDALAAVGIVRVEYRLDGGGDSGDTTLEEVEYADGRVEESMPTLPLGFTMQGHVSTVGSLLEDHASDAPDFDWVNNEGGSGTVTYHTPRHGERLEVSMSMNDDDDHDDEDEDDEDYGPDGGDEEGEMTIGGDE